MKKSNGFIKWTVMAGALAFVAHNAQSQTPLYLDSTTYQNANFNYGNAEAGNEIVLAGSSPTDLITKFSFQYDFVGDNGAAVPTGNETADVTFYANNGPVVAGQKTPGTVLYTSGAFALGGYTTGATEVFGAAQIGAGIVVPQDFTFTVTFAGIANDETNGLALYSPPTVGANYANAWYKPSGGSFQLITALPGNPPLEFGAQFFTTSVPDSSCLPVSVIAVLAGFGWMKRFKLQA